MYARVYSGYGCIVQVYRDKQVTNVVESSAKVTIGNWCQADKPDCRHPVHTVTPYKCVGEWQCRVVYFNIVQFAHYCT